jgi:hypothetical protein
LLFHDLTSYVSPHKRIGDEIILDIFMFLIPFTF